MNNFNTIWFFLSFFLLPISIAAQIKKSDSAQYILENKEAFEKLNKLVEMEKNYLNHLNINFHEEEFIPRKKDQQRINSIPKIEAEKNAQITYIRKIYKTLENEISTEIKKELDDFIRDKSVEEINQIAVLTWYKNGEQEALYLALKATLQDPDSSIYWNNTAAIMNMSNMEELAIPILKYLKEKEKDNVPVLNNLGQAYLGLGDISSAEYYLKECLSKQPNHPEATRSMGVVEMQKGNVSEAAKHFENDVKNNLRQSSYDWLKKTNKHYKNRLSTIRNYYLSKKNYQKRNFFDNLGLENLSLPELPRTVDKTEKWLVDKENYIQSLTEEYNYWFHQMTLESQQEEHFNIHQTEPYISWLVNESIYELNEIYEYDLQFITNELIDFMAEGYMAYHIKLQEAKYPEPPDMHNKNAFEAYERLCCQITSSIMNNFMGAHNARIQERFDFVNGQWKAFLNELLNIIELSPTPSNKKLAYHYLTTYMSFLSGVVNNVVELDPPGECGSLSQEENMKLLKVSTRNLNLVCPSFLEYELPIPNVGSIKMNCSEFQLEGAPLSVVKAGYRKKFSDQTSTLYVKVGPSAGTKHFQASAEIQGFITFDRNDLLTNSGIIAEAKLALPQGLAELSATSKVEMNSGYSHEVKQDSRWIQSIKKTYSKY